jgi:hypothetical protein
MVVGENMEDAIIPILQESLLFSGAFGVRQSVIYGLDLEATCIAFQKWICSK